MGLLEIIGLVAVILVAYWLWIKYGKRREGFTISTNKKVPTLSIDISKSFFPVYNYYPRSSIEVVVRDGLIEKTLIPEVKPASTGYVKDEDVAMYLKSGALIVLYVFPPGKPLERKMMSVQRLDTPTGETVRQLHVGMVTPRFLGRTDNLQVVSNYAVQGRPYVVLHNLTRIPLRLSDNIVVPPMGKVHYRGRYSYGVALGTYFNDEDGLYPPFQYLSPATDIYWGLVSDQPQPSKTLYWQYSFDDTPDDPYNDIFEGFV